MSIEEEKQLLEDIGEIKRGLFGEPNLRVSGVFKRLEHIEKWICRADKKIILVTGVFTALMFGFKLFWDWVTLRGK